MLGGVACVSCHVICQVSAGMVCETVLQMCVWVTVIEVTCIRMSACVVCSEMICGEFGEGWITSAALERMPVML